jgi:uncharacterized protein YndB with AHSA1/START domain
MKGSMSETSVRANVTVESPIAEAFTVFTEGIGTWFPPEYNLLSVPIAQRVFEPFAGGRVYDRGTDGSECHWGNVLVYEPPTRVVIAWRISTQWKTETDPSRVSEVEVRFVADGPNRTHVELEHRHIDRHGEGWERHRDVLGGEGGWPGCIRIYAERLAKRA